MKKISDAILSGWKNRQGMFHISLLIFIFQFLLALFYGASVYRTFMHSANHSQEVSKLLDGYDHTVVRDLMHHNPGYFNTLLQDMKWVLIFYLIFGIFITGGAMYCVVRKRYSWKDFFDGGYEFYRSYAMLFGLYFLLFLIWTVLAATPILSVFPDGLEKMRSEAGFIYRSLAIVVVYIAGLAFIYNASIFSKLMMQSDMVRPFKAFMEGIRYCATHLFSSFIVFTLFILLFVILIFMYNMLYTWIGMGTLVLIVIMFLIQQGVSLTRIILRLMYYDSMKHLLFQE